MMILVAAALVAPAAAHGQAATPTPSPAATPAPTPAPAPAERRIAAGVKAGGIDVGGLTIEEATSRLDEAASPRLGKNVAVAVAGRHFRLTMRQAGLSFDAERTAKRAYYAGRDAGAASGTVDVTLAIRFRRAVVRDWVASIDRAVYRAPKDATVRITLRKIRTRGSRPGRDLDEQALRAAVESALVTPAAKRLLKPGRRAVPAKVTLKDLPRVYPTIITIDRNAFRLRLFKRLKLSKSYGIAVGAAGYDTPTGQYRIQNKAVNPVWTAPNKPWAGLFAGRSVPGGHVNNPLKARWLGIANGVGIHGTAAEYSIGSRASHGCIRMRVSEVIDLYDRVPVGTPVLIR